MSDHICPVVKIKLEPFPETDVLAKVMINGEQIIVNKNQFSNNDLAIWIPPDFVCPDTEQFLFLGNNKRVKPRRLCGEWSMGLLIPAPKDAKEGENWMEKLDITRHDPEKRFTTGGDNICGPSCLIAPKYDIKNFRKYHSLFIEGEEIVITEKLHGTSFKAVVVNDILYVGSRNNWKKENNKDVYWECVKQNIAIESWLRHNPNYVLYGEVFGKVQNLKYGAKRNQLFFGGFDIMGNKEWLDYDEARKLAPGVPWVPLLYRGPYSEKKILELVDGPSIVPGADHIREGIVIKPVKERKDPKHGRVQLKLVSNEYLSR